MISVRDGEFTTLFSYRIEPGVDWSTLIGADRIAAAMAGQTAVTAAIAAGRWGDEAAYALIAAIERDPIGASCLCALRRNVPFDAIELAGAHAAARLMETSIDDARKLAAAERAGAARLIRRSVRQVLERTRDPGALSRAAALIASSIDANGASIMLVDGAELRLSASVGLPPTMLGHRQRVGDGIAGYVAQSGEAVQLSGTVKDARFSGTDPDAATSLSIPLRVAGRIVGVLNVKRTAGGEQFDDLERMMVTDLADELARAVGPEPTAILERPAADPFAPARADARTDVSTATLRILAVEAHPVMQIGLRTVLEQEGMVLIGPSATLAEAVELIRQGLADVALVDLSLPDAEGIEVIERLHDAAPHLPLVAFSVDASADRVRAAVRAGASGYLGVATPARLLVAALRAAAAGLAALGPEEATALAEPHDAFGVVPKAARPVPPSPEEPAEPPATRTDRSPKDALSARELELLAYLAEGHTNKEIARAMVLAEDTVKKAVQTLIAKLGATDRTHAVVLALRSDLIQ